MKWNIGAVLLVVVAVSAEKRVRTLYYETFATIYSPMMFGPPIETFQEYSDHEIEYMELRKAGWYCYEMYGWEEEPIARSEMDSFAAGANKEGKIIIHLGLMSLVTTPGASGPNRRYCALAPPDTDDPPRTPNNPKIKYMILDPFKFYAIEVDYPGGVSSGLSQLYKYIDGTLESIENYLIYKVDLNRPGVISAQLSDHAWVLYPWNGS